MSGRQHEQVDEFDRPTTASPSPPDVRLRVGESARPPGRGWLLVEYNWDEATGVARCIYRRKWDAKERMIVEVPQPAGPHQDGWRHRPPIDRSAVLARHHESLRVQAQMSAIGAYGR